MNFSRAAEQLRLTQPAVSHQINSLEDELGVKLFQRTSKSVRLTQEGYQGTLGSDGEDALAKYGQVKPDMVLLDVMMPRLDGWEVCRRIRKEGDTPVIMLTAKGETFDKVLGLELGADDYIVKPFDSKEVVARIKAVLRRCAGGAVPYTPLTLPTKA